MKFIFKNIYLSLVFLSVAGMFFGACKKEQVERPKNLIDEATMVDILYDLSMLQAVKSQDASLLVKGGVDPRKYIYQKYAIDSLQLVDSNKYYALDIANYKRMYDLALNKVVDQKKLLRR